MSSSEDRASAVKFQLQGLSPGDYFFMILEKQGAAVCIKYVSETVISIAAFALQPSCEDVASYDYLFTDIAHSVIQMDASNFMRDELLTTLSNCLHHLDICTIQSASAKVKKANIMVPEDRDAVSPKFVLEWLLSFLGAQGESTVSWPSIRKKLRDRVIWGGHNLPWRRSIVWTAIKMCLHLTLVDTLGSLSGSVTYKSMLLSYHCHLMKKYQGTHPLNTDSIQNDFDLILQMQKKCSTRLSKLYNFINEYVIVEEEKAVFVKKLELCKEMISNSILPMNCVWDKICEDWKKKSQIEIPTKISKKATTFSEFENLLTIPNSHNVILSRNDGYSYPYQKRALPSIPDNLPLEKIKKEWGVYESSLQKSQPIENSMSLLCRFMLLAQWDAHLCAEYPFMKDFSIPIPFSCMRFLVLPSSDLMKHAMNTEAYFTKRNQGLSMLSEDGMKQLLLSYFSFNRELLTKLQDIRAESATLEEHKREEFRARIAEYTEKINTSFTMTHDRQIVHTTLQGNLRLPDTLQNHSFRCRRCALGCWDCKRCKLVKQANEITVTPFEHLLPENPQNQKLIVSELNLPAEIQKFREVVLKFSQDLCYCSVEKGQQPTRAVWVNASPLQKYCKVNTYSSKLNMISSAALFCKTHYATSRTVWNNKETDFILPNAGTCSFGPGFTFQQVTLKNTSKACVRLNYVISLPVASLIWPPPTLSPQ
jgi:hypothetical protein